MFLVALLAVLGWLSTTRPVSATDSAGVAAGCVGDCDADGRVAIDELVRGVNIALGAAELNRCLTLDQDGDRRVAIHELVVAVGSALNGCALPARRFRMGLTTFPPGGGVEEALATWDFVKRAGDLVALHYGGIELPWGALETGTIPEEFAARFELDSTLAAGREVYVAITSINEFRTAVVGDSAGGPFPESMGPALHSNLRLQRAFVNYALFVQRTLRPRYMAIGIEVNIYSLANPTDFQDFVSLYKRTYRALKEVDPSLVVFPTFQLEFLLAQEQFWQLSAFEPEIDRIAISLYPSSGGLIPSRIPADYIGILREFSDRAIVVTETGYGSIPFQGESFDAPGSEEGQVQYAQWLIERADELSMEFVVWFFAADLSFLAGPLPSEIDFFRFFADMGLATSDFRDKPVAAVWRQNLRRSRQP